MATNKCVFCKEYFEAKNSDRKFCNKVKCRIKWDFLMLSKKGYDPVLYYQDLIRHESKVKCITCEKEFPAKSIRDFFYFVCKDCKEAYKEDLIEEMLENPRKFLDSI